MKKAVKKSVNINNLVSSLTVNVRESDNYDIPQMKDQIATVGRILKPLSVEEMTDKPGYYLVLQGNRRTRAAQELYADAACPSDLKEALAKIDVMVFEDLTPVERESLIMDHGGEKPLGRTEVVKSVWRLDKMFMDEGQIAGILYFELADYTGNRKKLQEVPTEPKARAKFIKNWFHGTLGNYMLSISRMGDWPREQFLLTHRQEDKLTKEGEVVLMRCSRDRVTQLSAAITADKNGKGWTDLANVEISPTGEFKFTGGGEKFNELIQKFIMEDKNGKAETEKRPSVKDLRDKAGHYKSLAIKTALAIGAGENIAENGKRLLELDESHWALQVKCEILLKKLQEVKDDRVVKLIKAILSGPAAEVELALVPFVS